MTQHSRTTRLEHYINTIMAETHGHQRKAFGDFITALLVVRTCCQATLARYFANFEAASRRLTRWLHNPRLEPPAQARAHAQAVVAQLPLAGTVRVASDWTTADQQHLLVASLIVGRRAVPLYWEAYTTAERKGQQRAVEQAFRRQVVEQEVAKVERERLVVTADRGFGDGTLLAELARLQVPFVLRLPAHITVCLDQQWQKLGSLRMGHTTRRRALGRLWCLHSNPQRCWVTQARAHNKKGRWQYWHLVSNRPLSAITMAHEYARRFGCEIVQTQMTKRDGFPLRAGGHDVADFHLAVADDDPINEQCGQLSSLGKRQMVEWRADAVAKGLDAMGQGGHIHLGRPHPPVVVPGDRVGAIVEPTLAGSESPPGVCVRIRPDR